jgi:hypothetical protein
MLYQVSVLHSFSWLNRIPLQAIPYSDYPFISRWTLGLLLPLGYYETGICFHCVNLGICLGVELLDLRLSV